VLLLRASSFQKASSLLSSLLSLLVRIPQPRMCWMGLLKISWMLWRQLLLEKRCRVVVGLLFLKWR
jgi:hypothetical protein